ncbi:hypothetical protein [Maribacter luteus]|uniref:Uncharacterized protein n=1 Tax=Maribacter luteus TaxID=2594478 RepID=A0A6I2MJ61_9FLAO|nr:hypothetical protein [Maribacter luteus]MRX62600.1 hypothetical protein [Maribacter luteus]
MMKRYKVIWFDDEHLERKRIRESAHLKGITLVGYSNAEEGIAELEQNIEAYDAALLDGIFYETPSEKGKPTQDAAMGKVAKALLRLEVRKKLPWYILSGQDSFTKEENKYAAAFKDGKVFDKLGDEKEYENLWTQMIQEADKLPETQARQNNQEIFEIFELGYLNDDVENQVLHLIIDSLPSNTSELKGVLTNIRSVHESCLMRLQTIRVIPNANDSLNNILKHLSGNVSKDNGWKPTSMVYQTKEIKNLHEWIYYTCGSYIHYLENQDNDVYMISNYALESLRFGLFEILLWFKKTYKDYC